MLTPSSSSSSSSSSFSIHPWKYHIFLSFSGEDTRKNFTDHLHYALCGRSVATFRDDNNLKRGEDIAPGLLKAIGESWGSIIVFSEGYAFSGWCLEELAEIVKQRDERGHHVLPIFYHVEVTDLRQQTNSVAEAFAKHEERYMDNVEKIQRWRKALTKAADIAGYVLKDQYESKFINTIIEHISTKLLESHLHWKELHSKLNTRQDDVRIIGIYGTSGICKAAVAGVFYTQMSPYFEAKSFFADVGKVSTNNGLVSLQKLLLSQVLPEETFDFSTIYEGSEIISQKLPQKKVLIVMEDVDDIRQLKYMVGKKEWFGLGSKIIVTTENEQLLRSFGVDDVCKLTTTNAESAGKFHDNSIVDNRVRIGQALATTLIGKAPKICRQKIWDYLMDDEIGKIAVWGMGGVGKTTNMKLIHDQLLEENEKLVIWITVSRDMDIFKLQNSIAGAIEVNFRKDEDEAIRAGKIYEKLARNGKYVLILDDLWSKLSLEEVGIPEPVNGSKLLITTRLKNVCDYLNCQVIEMSTLSEPDAWRLYLKNVGQDVLNYSDDLLTIVKSVAGKCGGLPLALVTIAKSMRGERELYVWKNALYELSRCVKSVNDLDEKVFQQLKFTYDRLGDEKVKDCFLCCALYPEDFGIDELIKLWIAEGLLEEMGSMDDQINRGNAILTTLKSCCLIEKGTGKRFHRPFKMKNRWVKLHDVVRDMALRIKRSRYLVRAGMQLKEIPDEQEWHEDLEKVSLMYNRELQIPSQLSPPKCPKLTTLLLSNCSIKSIPDCFFEQMHGLKILDLSRNPIKSLPNSISDLETLTTLLLHCCYDLENVPSFSKLQALKKLDLGRTNIKDTLHGMERLVNLKYLDCSPKWTGKSRGGFVRGKEIGGLRKLEFFKVSFYDLHELNNYIQALQAPIKRPHYFEIFVGQQVRFYCDDKLISLNGCDIICSDGIKLLSDVEYLKIVNCFVVLCEGEPFFSQIISVPHDTFSSLVQLKIVGCKNIKKVFSSNWVLQKNLQNLTIFRVEACGDIEEIIASESEMGEEAIGAMKLALPKLRHFQLMTLPELKSICGANRVMVCDYSVSTTIRNCPKLKRIPVNLPLHDYGQPYPLPSLTTTSENRMSWYLSYFNICTDGLKVPSNVGALCIGNCIVDLSEEEAFFSRFIAVPPKTFSSLSKIDISYCKSIKKLFWSNCVLHTNLQNLECFCVHNCEDIEEIIASESELEEEGISSIKLALPKLRELSLRNLPKLKSVCSAKGVIVCDSIRFIFIANCPELKRIPLNLPLLDDGQSYPPLSLSRILIEPKEQWESIELDQPNAKSLLEPYVTGRH